MMAGDRDVKTQKHFKSFPHSCDITYKSLLDRQRVSISTSAVSPSLNQAALKIQMLPDDSLVSLIILCRVVVDQELLASLLIGSDLNRYCCC